MNALATVLGLALVIGGQLAAKPDFSGEWKLNVAKSDFGALPPPAFITRNITHAEPALTIVEQQRSDLGDQDTTRKYVTDGTETSFTASGADVKGSAKWDEATLVVVSIVDAIGLTFNDRMSVSADGNTLTSLVRIGSPQGDLDLTLVFEKQ
jgi:hypothetical protein